MTRQALSDIHEYQFPDQPSATEYCVFPAELEDDELVLFHATLAENAEPIVKEGFRIPDPTGRNGLASVTFAKNSSMALDHAMRMRTSQPGPYVILAVRYGTLDRKGLKINASDVHDFTLDPAPEVIGRLTVPASYQHV